MTKEQDFYADYYLRARNWAADLPQALTTEAIESVTGIQIPEPVKDLAFDTITFAGLPYAFFVTGEIANYVRNPDDKCVASSWVYRTLKEAPKLDYGYLRDALDGIEGSEKVLPDLKQAITEVADNVKPCFSLSKYAIGTAKQYMKGAK